MPQSDADRTLEERVAEWHKTETSQPLHEWLGMTWEQYCEWVSKGEARQPSRARGGLYDLRQTAKAMRRAYLATR